MPDEKKKKISAWVSYDTLTQLEDLGFHSQTDMILAGLERLLMSDTQEDHSQTNGRLQELQAHIETLKNDITRLEDVELPLRKRRGFLFHPLNHCS